MTHRIIDYALRLSRPILLGTLFSFSLLAHGNESRDCASYLQSQEPRSHLSAAQEWAQIEALPQGFEKLKRREQFFDEWSKKNPTALKNLAGSFYKTLMDLKKDSQRAYLSEVAQEKNSNGSPLRQLILELRQKQISFSQVLEALRSGAVETVLTSHPTQIQSAAYRLAGQKRDTSPPPDLAAPIQKLTPPEEARESTQVYFQNLYEANLRLRNEILSTLQEAFSGHPDFSLTLAENTVSLLQRFSTWNWDADGKNNVTADTMAQSEAIQQAAVFQLHLKQAEGIQKRLPHLNLTALIEALDFHSRQVTLNPGSTQVIQQCSHHLPHYRAEQNRTATESVRDFFESWISELNAASPSPDLREFRYSIRTFFFNHHLRQNISVIRQALNPLLEEAGISTDLQSLRRVGADQALMNRLRSLAERSENPILKKEVSRFKILAQDPGPEGTVISADTKTLEDIEWTCFWIELMGLTGKVRYFPLIEFTETFRQLPTIAEQLLKSDSLMRRQILFRSAHTGRLPELPIMFALSDTSRLGSQAAAHLMEIQAAKLRQLVREKFAPIQVSEFWGGGSQIARGGDWISDQKRIYTDQGNARDLKYDSPEMALVRMERHLAFEVRSSLKEESASSDSTKDLEKLLELISTREQIHHSLFFDPKGYRNAMEAYLLFGSTLTEAKSNNYGARPVNRDEDAKKAGAQKIHRLIDRSFENEAGISFEQLVQQEGQSIVLKMRLKEVWARLRPGTPYQPPSIDQRAITIDNALSESKINQLAASVLAETRSGIDLATSARFMTETGAPFKSYQRQKAAEVIATSLINPDSFFSRLPPALRTLLAQRNWDHHFEAITRGRSSDELTVEDWIATLAFMRKTIEETILRNQNLEQALNSIAPAPLNPITRAKEFARSTWMQDPKFAVKFGQSFLAWIHQRTSFGSSELAPRGIFHLFPSASTDLVNQLEYFAWALHYEGQQLPVQVNQLAR